jgi:hypothetical protein
MKKSMMFAIALLLSAATVSFSQTTTGSGTGGQGGNPDQKTTQDSTSTGQDKSAEAQPAPNSNSNMSRQEAQQTTAESGATRPGGAEGKNANDVGRYSDGSSKSMLNSKEAVETRNKNLTEADTTVKRGSGSGRKNMKNRTGKTGNYNNQDARQSLKDSPKP